MYRYDHNLTNSIYHYNRFYEYCNDSVDQLVIPMLTKGACNDNSRYCENSAKISVD